ncbi:EF-hand domain-containing protein [Thermopolyspora sp. NPDC052614]|uniref:EF-hand domain-containing protein n=1 Tax=Thermopolyspora sp. NPDC052614 TaxID=3155682 RepID=UPI003416B0B6
MSSQSVPELRKLFDEIDQSGDGYISQAEFVRRFPHVTAEALAALGDAADVDGDGRISFEEFVRLLA